MMAFFAFSDGPKGFSLAKSRAFNGAGAFRAIFFSVQASVYGTADSPGFTINGLACTLSSRLAAKGRPPANRAPLLRRVRRLIELPIRVYFWWLNTYSQPSAPDQLPKPGYEKC